jgi:hypothetical protein
MGGFHVVKEATGYAPIPESLLIGCESGIHIQLGLAHALPLLNLA